MNHLKNFNDYQVDYFYPDGNGADTKMGNIEKYILGLLPSSLGDLYAFIGNPIVVDEYCEKTLGKEDVFSICFNASNKKNYVNCRRFRTTIWKSRI